MIAVDSSQPPTERATFHVVASTILIVAASLSPSNRPQWLAVPAFAWLMLLLSSRCDRMRILRRMLLFSLIAATWSTTILLSYGWVAWPRAILLLSRSTLAFGSALWLTETTTPSLLLAALARLRIPATVVILIAALLRQITILQDETRRMLRAKSARTFRKSGVRDWPFLASLLGLLFVRSHDRAERTHQAMLARGWTGNVDPLLPL